MIVHLCNEGVGATVFESQVLEYAQGVSDAGAEVSVVTLALGPRVYLESRKRLSAIQNRYSLPITLLPGVHQALPFSGLANRMIVLLCLVTIARQATVLHCRSEYSVYMAVFAKRLLGFGLLWDCRGDTEDEHAKKWQDASGVLARAYSRLGLIRIRRWKRVAAGAASAAIFVSASLQARLAKTLCLPTSYILPNVASRRYFYFSQELRQSMRRELGIAGQETVIAFVGSDASWHCLPEMARFLTRALETDGNARALLLMERADSLLELLGADLRDRTIAMYASFDQVNGFLNAADFSLLLLPPDPFSHVASPVKHAEYCLAGLPVLHNGSVAQVVEIGARLGNAMLLSDTDPIGLKDLKLSNERRSSIALEARDVFDSEGRVVELETIYRSFHAPR